MSTNHIKFFSTFMLAFVSMMYEFVIAQTITSYIGSTFYVYCLTIGTFTFSLGIGSIFYDKLKHLFESQAFYICELLLSLFGCLSPLLVILLYYITPYDIPLLAKALIMLLPGLICGFLSGFELPFLMEDLKQGHVSFKILSFDYAGMFLATFLFPTFFLLKFNLLQLSFGLGLTNLIVLLIYPKPKALSKPQWSALSVLALIIAIGLLNHQKIITTISQRGF